ncbi:Cytochrome b6-f complex iron-sulfur subunit [Klebsormidium nitens]|uniref:plastoquinol--plastocyanin reductase n=1 Tax=Klebsormidium nitens TaxID=105231 RepID=A0A1Y1IBZ7_KLENI|nr:Cytochrome b6-f complex iron-sulfur subunit [Klebsormidium nitens]|eukprot:GAQ88485.1 Cytochrome b6-f complex iron-sulfur subunit [Klebsormidium nitens]
MASATMAASSSAAVVPRTAFTPSASKLGSSSNGLATSVKPFVAQGSVVRQGKRAAKVVSMAAVASDKVPDMNKRVTMNLLLVGALSLPAAGLLGPYAYFFVPPSSGSAGGGVVAKDALGNDVAVSKWTKTHLANDKSLVQGLKGDPTYLTVKEDLSITTFGINAVCTHLGCVVPWNQAENKFMCPCHGSQYNSEGKVVRGPAPLSLALAHADTVDDKVVLSPWTETDFRTGEKPWWS